MSEQRDHQERHARDAYRHLHRAKAVLVGAVMGAPYQAGDLIGIRRELERLSGELAKAVAWRATERDRAARQATKAGPQ